jgi:hypothetical protein
VTRLRPIEVEKRKLDGSVSARHAAQLVRATRHSIAWLVPAGTRRERPLREHVEQVERKELWLAPRQRPWLVCARPSAAEGALDVTVHAALPAETTPGGVAWIDLDLDLLVEASGAIELRDVDVFVARAREFSYPDDVVATAWAGIGEATGRLVRASWPFDGTFSRLLASLEPVRAGR